jgi:RimJ/RimL family protein N-acetyltransferase
MDTNYSKYNISATLMDGTPAIIRAIHPEDKQFLIDRFNQLSSASIFNRFFHSKRKLSNIDLAYLTELDFKTHVGLVAVVEEDGTDQPVGVGRFIAKTNQSSAEVAFVVDECYQGLGIATLLLQHLTIIARMLEFREFTADVLPENEQMLRVFRNSGLAMRTHTSDGICKIWLSLTE